MPVTVFCGFRVHGTRNSVQDGIKLRQNEDPLFGCTINPIYIEGHKFVWLVR